MAQKRSQWTRRHTISLIAIIVAIVLTGLFTPKQLEEGRMWGWVLTLVLLVLFTAIAGHGITGLKRGLLIDNDNRLSLSRLQMILWTILVISGYLAAALSNIALGDPTPLAIAIPEEVWLLLGISTTALVGSPLIKSTKKAQGRDDDEARITQQNLVAMSGMAPHEFNAKGQIVYYTSPESSSMADLFRGEETGNAAHLDLSKIQMFFFTIVLVLAYLVALGTTLSNPGTASGFIEVFPDLDASMVALLGISNAGYLTNKAVPHSATGPVTQPTPVAQPLADPPAADPPPAAPDAAPQS